MSFTASSYVGDFRKLTPGQRLSDPTNRIQVSQHIISWVDDTVNKEDLSHNTTINHHIQRVGDILKKWRWILRTTGGDLELSKTVVYLLDYVFADGGTIAYHEKKCNQPGRITLEAELRGDKTVDIKRHDVSKAERYVGVRVAPNG